MKPTFPGILGREFARVDKGTRALRPSSVPGLLVSRTTKGVLLKPIRRPQPKAGALLLVQCLVEHDDWLQCTDEAGVIYDVLKAPALRSDWTRDYLANFFSGTRKVEYLRTEPGVRLVFMDGTPNPPPPQIPTFNNSSMFQAQIVWPPFFDYTPGTPVDEQGREILIGKLSTAKSLTVDGSEKPFTWIDLNSDSRQWVALSTQSIDGYGGIPITLSTDNLDAIRLAVRAWLNGHLHALEDAVYGNGNYVWTPAP